ncbi:Lcl domain-containing protein [Parabacteroides sp.]
MKKRKHRASAYHRIMMLSACLLIGLSWSCNDDLEKEDNGGKGNEETRTITLPVNLSFTPITETKAVTRPVKPGSELEKAGFHYELEVTSSTTADTLSAPDTKAVPTQLKNVVALLFGETTGKYKGKATVSGTVTAESDLLLDFTVNTTTDTSYRLVVIANDNAAENSYASSPVLSSFQDTYAKFLEVKMTNTMMTRTKDEDVPYVGSITGISMEGASSVLAVPLYRMLAKVRVIINNFSIKGGGAFNSQKLVNIGVYLFGTSNAYNGSGSITTLAENIVSPNGDYASNDQIYYVGENIQSYSVTSVTDRCLDKAPNATYLRLITNQSNNTNTSPSVGEEYITSGGVYFMYYIFLGNGSVSDFSVRRNTNYTITVNIDGTLEGQRQQAQTDKRIEVVSNEVHAGLNIGKFGGAVEFPAEVGDPGNKIAGYYTKDLLIEPNTIRTTAKDNVEKIWSNSTTQLQTQARRYWDPTYTVAFMDKTADLAYDYCYNLTLGSVAKGTWYLPTQAQLGAIWGILQGIQEDSSYANYSAFAEDTYWSATENAANAWTIKLSNGHVRNDTGKSDRYHVRCVRDL